MNHCLEGGRGLLFCFEAQLKTYIARRDSIIYRTYVAIRRQFVKNEKVYK